MQSSELEAIMLSLKGFHCKSSIGPWWPVTRPAVTSILPVCKKKFHCFVNNRDFHLDLTTKLKYKYSIGDNDKSVKTE